MIFAILFVFTTPRIGYVVYYDVWFVVHVVAAVYRWQYHIDRFNEHNVSALDYLAERLVVYPASFAVEL